MTDKQAFEMVLNGANFTIEYGTNSFNGTITEFRKDCKNIADYFHKSNNFFNFWLIVNNQYEYTITNQVKSKIRKMLEN